jgi:hypothetical protein
LSGPIVRALRRLLKGGAILILTCFHEIMDAKFGESGGIGTPPGKYGEKKMKRTTHRSRTGKKLYAVRDAKGRFVDIQTYERAHRMDLKKKSRKEAGKAKTK